MLQTLSCAENMRTTVFNTPYLRVIARLPKIRCIPLNKNKYSARAHLDKQITYVKYHFLVVL